MYIGYSGMEHMKLYLAVPSDSNQSKGGTIRHSGNGISTRARHVVPLRKLRVPSHRSAKRRTGVGMANAPATSEWRVGAGGTSGGRREIPACGGRASLRTRKPSLPRRARVVPSECDLRARRKRDMPCPCEVNGKECRRNAGATNMGWTSRGLRAQQRWLERARLPLSKEEILSA